MDATGTRQARWQIALWAVVAVAAGAGVVLRFVAPSPMWLDEALSVNIASLDPRDAVDALIRDGHPLLYYAVLGVWLDLVGNSDFGARALSGLFSLAAAGPLWAAARRRLGADAARYAAVLALTSPFLIRYGSEARMYALAALLAALGWWLTELCVEQPGLGRLAALALTVAAGLYTHYWMIWLSVSAFAVLAVLWLRGPDRRDRLGAVLAAYGAGGLTFVPWLPVLAEQAAHTGTPWAEWARPAEVAIETIEAVGGGKRFEPMLLGVALIGAAALGATVVRATDRTLELGWPARNPAAPVVAVAGLTLGVGGLVAAATGTAFEARYVAVAAPLLLALAGRGLATLPRWAAPAALAAICAFSVAVAIDDARRDRSQGEDVADAIDTVGGPSDVVVFCPDQLAPAVLRYLDTPMRVQTFPPHIWRGTPSSGPHFVDWYDYRDRINAASVDSSAVSALSKSSSGSVWLVMAPGYHGFADRCQQLASRLRRGDIPEVHAPQTGDDPPSDDPPKTASPLAARTPETVIKARPVYEPMGLIRYPPP